MGHVYGGVSGPPRVPLYHTITFTPYDITMYILVHTILRGLFQAAPSDSVMCRVLLYTLLLSTCLMCVIIQCCLYLYIMSVATFGSKWSRIISFCCLSFSLLMARGAPKAKGRGRGRGTTSTGTASSMSSSSMAIVVADPNSSLVAQAEAALPTTSRHRPNRRDADEQACCY